jgi:hypothetical protein
MFEKFNRVTENCLIAFNGLINGVNDVYKIKEFEEVLKYLKYGL